MSVFNKIVPGGTDNGGIVDVSIPDYLYSIPAAPLHLPVIHLVTPKGKLAEDVGTQWIPTKDFAKIFGNVFDTTTPFYNPSAALISALAQGTQGTIGVRRLSMNKEVARTALSMFMTKKTQLDYERDAAGRFKYDTNGDLIVKPGKTYEGLEIVLKQDPEAATSAPGQLKVRTITDGEGNETVVYPMWESLAGVGDEYNKSGMVMGVRDDVMNWRAISEFVRNTGLFPFDLRQFTENTDGEKVFAKTAGTQRDSARFTLFETTVNNVKYSIKNGFGAFTGTNVNRPVLPVPAPFNDVIVYEDNIDTVAQLMYAVEKDANSTLVEVGESYEYYKQMNPLTCVNHTGAPYYAISLGDYVKWDMTGSVKAIGGISPFLDDKGEVPDFVTKPVINDPLGLLAGLKRPLSMLQGWEINNRLMVTDLTGYVNGPDMRDTTRNRQSLFWDVGYTQPVKDIVIQMLGRRKDVIVIPDGTIWQCGPANAVEDVYARAATIVSQLRMTPESEKWGTPACRAAVNLPEIKLTDEKTGFYFSQNIDLAYAFALFAGNNNGLITVAYSPDHADNRKLRIGHSPTIVFEDDDVAAENFAQGIISLKPYDWVDQTYRAGLPTVTVNPDSVLKDLMTPFLCVCMEKISADQWRLVTGDTTIDKESYESIMKDNIEEECRRAVGGMVGSIVANTSYEEGVPGSRAKLRVAIHGWFNKAKYMMEFDLYAHNQQDLAETA